MAMVRYLKIKIRLNNDLNIGFKQNFCKLQLLRNRKHCKGQKSVLFMSVSAVTIIPTSIAS